MASLSLALMLGLLPPPDLGEAGNAGLVAEVGALVEGFWRHEPELPSLVVGVVHEGETLWSRAFGFASCIDGERVLATTATRYAIASCLKPMVAVALLAALEEQRPAAAGQAWEAGVVPLARWFGERAEPSLTVRDLLAHRVVLGGPVADLPGALTVGGRAEDCSGWKAQVDPLCDGHPFTALSLAPCAAPGMPCSGHEYSNDAYWLAGYLLTKVAVPADCPQLERWPVFGREMRRLVWGPLGMTSCGTEAACDETPPVARPHQLEQPSRSRREDRFAAEYHRRFRAGPIGEAYASLDDVLRFARATARCRHEPGAPLARCLDAATRRHWTDDRGLTRRPGWLGPKAGRPDTEVWIYGIKDGYLAFAGADPEKRAAVCLLTNTGCDGCCREGLAGEPSSLLLRNRLQALAHALMDLAGSGATTAPATLSHNATLGVAGYVHDERTGLADPVYKDAGGRLSVVRADRLDRLDLAAPSGPISPPSPAQVPPTPDPVQTRHLLGGSLPQGFVRDPDLERTMAGTWRGSLARSNRWSYLTVEWAPASQGEPEARIRIGPSGTRDIWDRLDLLAIGRREVAGVPRIVLHGALGAMEGERSLELLDAEWHEGEAAAWMGTWRHGGRSDHFVLARAEQPAERRRPWSRMRAGTWAGTWGSPEEPGGTLVLTLGAVGPSGSRKAGATVTNEGGEISPLTAHHDVEGWMDADGAVRFSSPLGYPCAYHVFGAFLGDECDATILRPSGAHPLRLRRSP